MGELFTESRKRRKATIRLINVRDFAIPVRHSLAKSPKIRYAIIVYLVHIQHPRWWTALHDLLPAPYSGYHRLKYELPSLQEKHTLLAVCTGDDAHFVGRDLDVALPVLADARVENVAGTALAGLPVGAGSSFIRC